MVDYTLTVVALYSLSAFNQANSVQTYTTVTAMETWLNEMLRWPARPTTAERVQFWGRLSIRSVFALCPQMLKAY